MASAEEAVHRARRKRAWPQGAGGPGLVWNQLTGKVEGHRSALLSHTHRLL